MITNRIMRGEMVHLRTIELGDCIPQYVGWLNNPLVNQYLETRWKTQTLDEVTSFVNEQRENNHSVLFAIILNDCGRHIGNIKIGPVNFHYLHADVSYFIGETNYWNMGIATEAINLACRFGFEDLKLRRVEAGAYAAAVGSWKALERNGFVREGTFRRQVISNGTEMDVYRYGLLREEFKKQIGKEKI